MSSLLSALSIVESGLSVISTQLQITSSNVTNAGTEGYTRKSAIIASANLGDTGGGVTVTGYTRATDTALFNSLMTATSETGYLSTQDDYMQQVMDILGLSSSDDPAISAAITDFVNAWTTLESEPESSVAQQEVIQSAVNLTDEIKRISSEVEELDRQCQTEIRSTVEDLNSYLLQLKNTNAKIASAYTSGLSAGNLEDERDQLLLKISEIAEIKTISRENGQIAVYTATGYQLMDGTSVASFYFDGTDVFSEKNTLLSLNSSLKGGSLEALLDFRDTSDQAADSAEAGVGTIRKLRDQLNLIADAFLSTTTTATDGALTFEAAYRSGTTEAGELSQGFFTGSNRTDIAINADLLDGDLSIKQDSIDDVVDAILNATRAFSTSGLETTGASYATLVTASLTDFQQTANSIASSVETADQMADYLKEKYTNATNVSVDDEMITLVTLQNIYSANARVLSVVQDLFDILASLV